MSDYVYNYGDGDKTWTLNEYDSLTIDSDTANHVIGIQESDNITKIVFDNYSSLNVGGRPGAIIVDGVTVVSNEATSVYITPIDTINRNYVYNYGDGDKTLALSEYDTLTLDSDTANHVIGIQESGNMTKIVFDNYSSLNIGGRPGAIIVDGETIVSNEMPTATSGTIDITTYDSDMYANTSDIVNLDSLGITPNRIVGIRQVTDARTTVVYDTYRSLNIWGYPGEVISNGQTIISHNPGEDWGVSFEDYFETAFGNQVVYLNENDIINLSSVSGDDVLGVNIEDNNSMFVFSGLDIDSLRVYGKPSTALIGNVAYGIDYDNHTITPIATITPIESTTTTEA